MVQITDDFDAREEDLKPDFDLLPAGEYKVAMTESDLKTNSKGTGDFYKFTWEVLEGKFKGQKIWQMITRTNESEKATLIGRKQFAELKLAVGKPVIKDTQELHNRPCTANVVIEKGTGGYADQNKIKGFVIATEKTKGQKKLEKMDVPFEEDDIEF